MGESSLVSMGRRWAQQAVWLFPSLATPQAYDLGDSDLGGILERSLVLYPRSHLVIQQKQNREHDPPCMGAGPKRISYIMRNLGLKNPRVVGRGGHPALIGMTASIDFTLKTFLILRNIFIKRLTKKKMTMRKLC